MWAQLALIAVGVWLEAAPAVLGYGGPAATSDRVAGPVMIAIALVALSRVTRAVRWLNLATGAWLVVAPWLLGFPAGALASSAVAGVLALVLAPRGRSDPGRFGGGWRALLR